MQDAKVDNRDRKQIRFGALLEEINKARGNESLASWVKGACKERLKKEKGA